MYSDKSYFRRRAAEERASAARAVDRETETRHVEMSLRFDDLAAAIAQRDYLLGLDLYADDTGFDPHAPAGRLEVGASFQDTGGRASEEQLPKLLI
jgi:hypothetical protein